MSAEPGSVPILRTSMETYDFGESEDLLRRRYVDHHTQAGSTEPDFLFRSRMATAGPLIVDSPQWRAGMTFHTQPFDAIHILTVVDGRAEVTAGRQQAGAKAGSALLYPVGLPLEISLDRSTQIAIQFPVGEVRRVSERFGLDPADFRFDAMNPVSPAAARRWEATATYLNQLMAGPEIHQLLLRTALDVVTTTAVTVFPNTAMTVDYIAEPGRIAPAVIRRAVAYVDEHAAEPLTVEEIAAAAGIGTRTLQVGFRRHLDTTPAAYLRHVRLQRAHRDLQAADAARGDTVADIAYRWGFANLGRFAGYYREAFGRRPSQTLQT
ncbi:AraC family transcriptional regulator [Actinoplanes sp. LDG1-06]|uniref:AraC family transcriptional regulator n=1 Tax=Paractinoplanes ovalisporus TaxID=2810368 RepID=A0ABS2ARQ4_9ACTN|nr:AraC family transcriptional regulator [Actinoplanes ovalisporus]MBM2621844.1 AraC family transcriptional regulator [Actinoplanes ovalisporus]